MANKKKNVFTEDDFSNFFDMDDKPKEHQEMGVNSFPFDSSTSGEDFLSTFFSDLPSKEEKPAEPEAPVEEEYDYPNLDPFFLDESDLSEEERKYSGPTYNQEEADLTISQIQYKEEKQKEIENELEQKTISKVTENECYKDLEACLLNNQTNIATCHSIIVPDIKGFKGFFVGERSSTIKIANAGIPRILYKLHKISSPEAVSVPFNEVANIETFDSKTLYIIYDLKDAVINLFSSDTDHEASTIHGRYQRILEKILASPADTFIILEGDSSDYIGFNALDPRIRYKFDKKCNFEDLSSDYMATEFMKYVESSGHTTNIIHQDAFNFLENNRRFYPFKNQELIDYMTEYFELNGSLPPDKFTTFNIEQAFSNIIGMQNIKDNIRALARLLRSRRHLKEIGMNPDAIPLRASIILTGPAGTGKTTVARIIAHLYFDMGVLPEDKLIEISSSDLVSGEPGMTERKTNRIIQNALGGALFLDECYSLADSGSAGLSALALLIKAMEDYRDRFVVIFAGYKKEVQEKFLPMNSGLDSRCTTYDLRSYTIQELFEIFQLKLKLIGVHLETERDALIQKRLNPAFDFAIRNETRGQGRFVEKIVQGTMINHAEYLENHPGADPKVITYESIPRIDEVMKFYR